jgi:adenylate kinase family enzyme
MSYIIYLFGPSASGKSTVTDILQQSIDNLEVIDFDTIKRQIPGYDWTLHAQAGRSMTLDKLKLAITEVGKILLLMPPPRNLDEYELIHSIAKAQNYTLINVEITAPKEVLVQRYKDRLAHIESDKKEWKFKTLDEFIRKLDEPYYIPEDTNSFDSSTTNPDDTAAAILALIK